MASSSAPLVTAEERYASSQGVQLRDTTVFLVDWRYRMATGRMHDDSGEHADGVPPLAVALETIVDVMMHHIKDSAKDMFGVVAFGAGHAGEMVAGSSQRWEGVRVIVGLEELTAQGIVKLQEIILRLKRGDARSMRPGEEDGRRRRPDFCFGEDEAVDVKNALLAVRTQFQEKKLEQKSRAKNSFENQRCFVFTDDHNPVSGFEGGGEAERDGATNAAGDLSEMGVTLEVAFLRVMDRDDDFDPSLFYKALVHWDGDEYADGNGGAKIKADGFESAAELHLDIRAKTTKKRSVGRLAFKLDKGLVLGVALYSVVRNSAPPRPGSMEKSTGKRVIKTSQTNCAYRGTALTPKTDIRINFDKSPFMRSHVRDAADEAAKTGVSQQEAAAAFDGDSDRDSDDGDSDTEDGYKDERAPFAPPPVHGFTPEELKSVGNLGEMNGLALFGFRDEDKLRQELILKHANFVYPDEFSVKGSKKIFAALHTSMVKAKKMAIVLRGTSAAYGTGPRFHALLAQDEEIDEEGIQVKAPGMILVPLPFKNDVYTGWREELNAMAKEEEGEENKEVTTGGLSDDGDDEDVSKLVQFIVRRVKRDKYNPKDYRNPAIDKYFNLLEKTTGVRSSFTTIEDSLLPNVDLIRERTTRFEGTEKEMDYLKEFQKLTIGEGVSGKDLAALYGTKTARGKTKTAENRLKRKAETDARAAAARDDIGDGADFEEAAREGKLARFTVVELKKYCLAHQLSVSGKKQYIIDRIDAHVNGAEDEMI